MMTKVEDQVAILVDFQENFGTDNPVYFYSMGNNLAFYKHLNMCALTPKGRKEVSYIFDILLGLLGVKDTGFKTMREILIESQNGNGVKKKWANKQIRKLGIS